MATGIKMETDLQESKTLMTKESTAAYSSFQDLGSARLNGRS